MCCYFFFLSKKGVITVLVLIVLFISGCIKPFEDYNIELNKPKLVVDAFLSNKSSEQEIKLTLSKALSDEEQSFLTNYDVKVFDRAGNEYLFYCSLGTYRGIIPVDSFYYGNAFRVEIISPEGDVYKSSFDEVGAQCDMLPAQYKTMESNQVFENEYRHGVQFWVEVLSSDESFFYYTFDETYEYHATFPIRTYYDGRWVDLGYSDFSKQVCYKTEYSDQIYLGTTAGILHDSTVRFPLHFVDNHSQKLYHNYSLNLFQYSISKEAYLFFEKLQKNLQNSGGIMDSYPINAQGNIYCETSPECEVLGGFWVSQVTECRTNFSSFQGVKKSDMAYCTAYEMEDGEFEKVYLYPEILPFYYFFDKKKEDYFSASKECFDCRAKGGKLEKPWFFVD